jgi:hypothetical protein
MKLTLGVRNQLQNSISFRTPLLKFLLGLKYIELLSNNANTLLSLNNGNTLLSLVNLFNQLYLKNKYVLYFFLFWIVFFPDILCFKLPPNWFHPQTSETPLYLRIMLYYVSSLHNFSGKKLKKKSKNYKINQTQSVFKIMFPRISLLTLLTQNKRENLAFEYNWKKENKYFKHHHHVLTI